VRFFGGNHPRENDFLFVIFLITTRILGVPVEIFPGQPVLEPLR
jgi:hypothetical protein